jgi:hypothetical protein
MPAGVMIGTFGHHQEMSLKHLKPHPSKMSDFDHEETLKADNN